jgi:predicted nucleic acid-binding protein
MSWLLDTCVLSEYAKKTPTPQVITWLDEQDETSLFISVITLGEIEKGILKLRASDPTRSQKLTAWLGKVEQRFAGRILPLDTATLHAWAQLAAHAELAGQALPVMDGLLMATAQCHGFTVVTRNDRDFSRYQQVFNPWVM